VCAEQHEAPWDVCVVGCGYVGMPLCINLARAGQRVLGVDVEKHIVSSVEDGSCPFEEETLAQAFGEGVVRANFRARLVPAPADVYVIAVPTPVAPRTRVADLTHVTAALLAITPHLRPGDLIVIESTVPPLTCRDVITPLLAEHGWHVGRDVLLAHCPERILPGDVMHEIVHNDRVIGGCCPAAASRACDLYGTFVRGELLVTDDVTAELCKLMENTYRDVNIALANELAAVCATVGVDVREAVGLANRHPRVDILTSGIGAGGHCIPVDPWFIRQVDPDNARLIEVARRVNDDVPRRVAAAVRRRVSALAAPRIAVVGESYKPNTADRRESPARVVIQELRADGYDVTVHDPWVAAPDWPTGGVREIAAGMDCLVVLVEHDVVRRDLEDEGLAIRSGMRHPIVLRFPDVVRPPPAEAA
jgi:UDP-N-acetyl-D-mannosaminuronic acid dehydrogenase